ncbi:MULTISPECIES: SDR family NAD(P)-dependent oxidoreductase [Ramlibacter]|uniref:SDR family oxidoreductase n=1 Tax=Ramlibacter pinisoli TaxID=2682844 RepID=A0A6N8ITQ1_9BURK|nr:MULTISPECIES: SDR family oxidoreductase [Ramlibacter]MBA2964440.1 SDR family oxidoreductase [Ramlibacter sp. CGMCC 1.13660]MVQ29406.1 SDR family oxidoreductase [Ramlibacter pinisoli]
MNGRKVAVVTGSGSGVGAATVLLFAQRGYDVVVNWSRSEREAQDSAAACRAAGADVLVQQADVADDAQCRALVAAAVGRWGRLDALVNNAAVSLFGAAAKWDALDPQAFHQVMGVNTVGAFQMVRAALSHLKETGGSIVNVSSIAGTLGIGSSAPYVASKGALNALTLYLARALAPQVRVNAVCPGLVTSRWFARGMGEAAADKVREGYEADVPLGRSCTPEDVAEAIVWLADGARTTTGELLALDGGMHLGRVARR